MGRGRFLQLLGMPLSPCCPSCPAGMSHRFSQLATIHTAFAQQMGARLPVLGVSRPPMGSLSLRPGDSLTIPRMALSVGFIRFVSSTYATQATGFRLLPRWDCLPLNMPAFAGRTSVAPRFHWECITIRTVSWFPAPRTVKILDRFYQLDLLSAVPEGLPPRFPGSEERI